jgi:hypothetical protein
VTVYASYPPKFLAVNAFYALKCQLSVENFFNNES